MKLAYYYRSQRSWGKVIFSEACQEFCPARGDHAWQGCVCGSMCGRRRLWQGVHAWQGEGVCMAGGHVWWGGMHGRGRAWQILRDTVNERAVRILLECILVVSASESEMWQRINYFLNFGE